MLLTIIPCIPDASAVQWYQTSQIDPFHSLKVSAPTDLVVGREMEINFTIRIYKEKTRLPYIHVDYCRAQIIGAGIKTEVTLIERLEVEGTDFQKIERTINITPLREGQIACRITWNYRIGRDAAPPLIFPDNYKELYFDIGFAYPSTYPELSEKYDRELRSLQREISELRSDYADLDAEHDLLKSNYTSLEDNYEALEANSVPRADYNSLKALHEGLQTDRDKLKATYDGLQVDYNRLKADRDELKANRDSLLVAYNGLEANYTSILSSYDDLQGTCSVVVTVAASLGAVSAASFFGAVYYRRRWKRLLRRYLALR